MPLITCKECNNQVSDSANVCPHCGKKLKMNLFVKAFIVLISGFLLYSIFNTISSSNTSTTNASTALGIPQQNKDTSKGYKLNDRAKSFAHTFIASDMADTLAGKDTFLSSISRDECIDATAKELADIYEANEIDGDQKFLNKRICVEGDINSIESGINNKAFVTLDSNNRWQPVHVKFKDGLISRVAELKKQQHKTFVCNGAGEIAGNVMLDNCYFMEDYINDLALIITDKINLFAEGKLKADNEKEATIKSIEAFVGLSLYLEAYLPKDSKCYTSPQQCDLEEELEKIAAVEGRKLEMSAETFTHFEKNLTLTISELDAHNLTTISNQLKVMLDRIKPEIKK